MDDWTQASHSGEINVPFHNSQLAQSDILGNLGALITQDIALDPNSSISIFDSTGLAAQDLALLDYVYEKATQKTG